VTGVFNVARGERMTINDLAKTIRRLTRSRSKVIHAPDRPGDVKHSLASIDKIKAAGFAPKHKFADGMQSTIEFFKDRARKAPEASVA